MLKFSKKYSLLLAFISGVITAFVFPTVFGNFRMPNLGFLVWISLVPLFISIRGAGIKRAFGLAFVTAFTYHSISLYWLYNALTIYGKMSAVGALAVLFLMMVILSTCIALIPAWFSFLRQSLRFNSLYVLPLAWVAVELARNYFPVGGFSWNNLAYSQSFYPLFIQTADIFGLYGILFMIILVNVFLTEALVAILEKRKIPVLAGFVVSLIFILMISYGWFKLKTVDSYPPLNKKIKVALLQGNIPQEDKWKRDTAEKNLSTYRKLMEEISGSGIDLAIWPESAYPVTVFLAKSRFDPKKLGLDNISDKLWLLFGAVTHYGNESGDYLHNSAVIVDSNGMIQDYYHKEHLVPFGEYVPYKKILFFVRKLVAPIGDFVPGKEDQRVKIKGFNAGPLICYEDVFPEIARGHVQDGAELLITITNDAWYGRTSAAFQHLAISIFRSVETRRFMLRSANTGISAVIDPLGRVEISSDIFVKSIIVSNVSLLDTKTIYNRVGDAFVYICVIFVFLITLLAVKERRKWQKK